MKATVEEELARGLMMLSFPFFVSVILGLISDNRFNVWRVVAAFSLLTLSTGLFAYIRLRRFLALILDAISSPDRKRDA